MKITHVFSCKCRKKWCRYFNENSFDGYEYQTLNDYNPIINKLNDTDGKFVFQSDVKLLWGRTEKCLTWKHFTSVLYKKKNHHWMMNTIILSHQHKINYSSLHIQLPWSEDTNDSGAGNFQKKKNISTKRIRKSGKKVHSFIQTKQWEHLPTSHFLFTFFLIIYIICTKENLLPRDFIKCQDHKFRSLRNTDISFNTWGKLTWYCFNISWTAVTFCYTVERSKAHQPKTDSIIMDFLLPARC